MLVLGCYLLPAAIRVQIHGEHSPSIADQVQPIEYQFFDAADEILHHRNTSFAGEAPQTTNTDLWCYTIQVTMVH